MKNPTSPALVKVGLETKSYPSIAMLLDRSQLLFIFVPERPITSNECCRSDGSIVKPSWLAERLHVEMNCRKERHRFALRRHRFALICSLHCSNREFWNLSS